MPVAHRQSQSHSFGETESRKGRRAARPSGATETQIVLHASPSLKFLALNPVEPDRSRNFTHPEKIGKKNVKIFGARKKGKLC